MTQEKKLRRLHLHPLRRRKTSQYELLLHIKRCHTYRPVFGTPAFPSVDISPAYKRAFVTLPDRIVQGSPCEKFLLVTFVSFSIFGFGSFNKNIFRLDPKPSHTITFRLTFLRQSCLSLRSGERPKQKQESARSRKFTT